ASAADSCRGSSCSVRQRRCRCDHDAMAAVPDAETCRPCPADAWPRRDRSVRDVRPCCYGCCRTGPHRAGRALVGRSPMTLSDKQSDPIKPARIVVLGAGGFLGRRMLAACAAAGVATAGLGSRDLDLTVPDASAQLAQRLRPRDVLLFLAALTP